MVWAGCKMTVLVIRKQRTLGAVPNGAGWVETEACSPSLPLNMGASCASKFR